MPATPTPAEVARQWFQEIWINRDPTAIQRLMTVDSKGYLERDVTVTGPEEFLPVFHALISTFPDLEVQIDGVVGDDQHACVRWSARGKHAGPGMGVPATGKDISFRGITWMTVKDGKVTEGWDSWNQGALLADLGIN